MCKTLSSSSCIVSETAIGWHQSSSNRVWHQLTLHLLSDIKRTGKGRVSKGKHQVKDVFSIESKDNQGWGVRADRKPAGCCCPCVGMSMT